MEYAVKIALIRREYITHLDGVNRFIAWLAEGFAKLGHEPLVASWCYSDVAERSSLSKWFKEMHGLDIEVPIYTIEDGPCRGDPWPRILLSWWTRGSSLLKDLGADVAIVNGVAPLRFKPKMAVAHGPLSHVSRLQRLILKTLYRMYDYVVCVSEESRREYKGIAECDAIIPLPMKLDLYRPRVHSEREDVVVHIGTRPIKNPHISVEAVESLGARGYNVELVVIGGYSREVEELAKKRGFIKVLFNVDEKTKIDILRRAKALILPSGGEAFPFTSLEAMACGTPPIVSQAVPGDVILDSFNGLRIKSYNPQDYANALERLLRNEGLWLELSSNGRKFVERFDYVSVAKRYLELVETLIGDGS